jgi:hypothetical protein
MQIIAWRPARITMGGEGRGAARALGDGEGRWGMGRARVPSLEQVARRRLHSIRNPV